MLLSDTDILSLVFSTVILYPLLILLLSVVLDKGKRPLTTSIQRDAHRPGISLIIMIDKPDSDTIESVTSKLGNIVYPRDRFEVYAFTRVASSKCVEIIRNASDRLISTHISCYAIPARWTKNVALNNAYRYIKDHSILAYNTSNWIVGTIPDSSLFNNNFLLNISDEFNDQRVGIVYPQTIVRGNHLMCIDKILSDVTDIMSTVLTNNTWSESSIFMRGQLLKEFSDTYDFIWRKGSSIANADIAMRAIYDFGWQSKMTKFRINQLSTTGGVRRYCGQFYALFRYILGFRVYTSKYLSIINMLDITIRLFRPLLVPCFLPALMLMDWESYSEFNLFTWFWGTPIVYSAIMFALMLITVDKWWMMSYYPIYVIWYILQIIPLIIGLCMFLLSQPFRCPNDIEDMDNNSRLIKQLIPLPVDMDIESGRVRTEIVLNHPASEVPLPGSLSSGREISSDSDSGREISSNSDDEGLTIIELDKQPPVVHEIRTATHPHPRSNSRQSPDSSTSANTLLSGSVHDRYIMRNLP